MQRTEKKRTTWETEDGKGGNGDGRGRRQPEAGRNGNEAGSAETGKGGGPALPPGASMRAADEGAESGRASLPQRASAEEQAGRI